MHRHRIVRIVSRLVPDLLVDLFNGEHLSHVLHQEGQDPVLLRRQEDCLAVYGDRFFVIVQEQSAGAELMSFPGFFHAPQVGEPPQLGFDPGHQFHGAEGLGDVVVRPQVQSLDLVVVFRLRRQQDDGHVSRRPDLFRGGEPVQPGHHDVHDHQVHRLPFEDLQRLQAVVCREGAVAFVFQIDLNRPDDFLVVVADQNVHGRFLSWFEVGFSISGVSYKQTGKSLKTFLNLYLPSIFTIYVPSVSS